MRWPVLLVCAAAAAGCDIQVGERGVTSVGIVEGRARSEWTRTYTLQPGGTLEIANLNGRIDANRASGTEVEVRAEIVVRDHSTETAEAHLKKVQMQEDVTATHVRIEAQAPRGEQGILGHRPSLNVRYRISVPAGIAVNLRTENGEIHLDDLDGHVTAATTNGGINGEALSGPVSVQATNGGVQLDLPTVGGDIQVATTNGPVRIELAPGIKATLDANCVNGGIQVDDELKLQASQSSARRVAGTFNGGGPRIAASTVNGGIRIRTRETGRGGD